MYNFDTKKDIITLKAAKRIKEDWETKENVFTDAKEKAGLEEVYIPPTKRKRGGQRNNPAAHPATPVPAVPQATNHQTTNQTITYKITHTKIKLNMFAEEPKKPKIRKFTPQELETEKQVADAFKRPPCSFFW